jgi:hypothetical protein
MPSLVLCSWRAHSWRWLHAPGDARIKGVAQAIAQDIDRQHGYGE